MVKDNDAGGAGGQGNPYKIVSSSVLEEGGKPATGNANRVHPSFYIGTWMVLSSTIILFNKYILDKGGFPFPILLTTWHLVFATGATRILRKTTGLLDGIDAIQMDWTTWFKAVVPIGALFSATLILSNMAYLYLSVSFIQMLKATTPVAVLLMSWCAGTEKPNLDVFWKVSIIVFGVILATYGEFDFVFIGFVVQCLGILFEAGRLVLVQKLLHAYKMDPLCSLYYFAPVCAAMNFAVFLVVEAPRVNAEAFVTIGYGTLLANASVAFALNCAVVFLVGP
ncbi:hypothetical protein HKX48_000332 [Thoreauomyces humboldtii]|nr:hypothetical protein HKX48_000332 [Thoreauomyces humboldtii]